MSAKTLYDKLWDDHVIRLEADGTALLYIDYLDIYRFRLPAGSVPLDTGSLSVTSTQ